MLTTTHLVPSYNLTQLWPLVQTSFVDMSSMMSTINKVNHSVELCQHGEFNNEAIVIDQVPYTFSPDLVCDTSTMSYEFANPLATIKLDEEKLQNDITNKVKNFFSEKATACYAVATVTLSNVTHFISSVFVTYNDGHLEDYHRYKGSDRL